MGWTTISIAIALGLLRSLTPLFTPSMPQLAAWAANEISYPFEIKEIQLTWEGYHPAVTLSNVDILDPQTKLPALHIHKMEFRLNLLQLLIKKLQVDELVIDGANVGIEYQSDGLLFVANLPQLQINVNNTSSSSQFSSLKKFKISNSAIKLIHQDKQLALNEVNAQVVTGIKIKVRSDATLDGNLGKLSIQADIPVLENKKVLIYAHWQGEDISQMGQFIQDLPVKIVKGSGDVKIWYQQEDKNTLAIVTNIQMKSLQMQGKTGKQQNFDVFNGMLTAKQRDNQWHINANEWKINENEAFNFNLTSFSTTDGRTWELKANEIDLLQWHRWISQLSLLPEKWEKVLDSYQFHGQIDYIHLQALSNPSSIKPTFADIVFTDFGMKATNRYPGLSSISGALTFDNKHGKVVLQSEQLQVDYPGVYTKPLTLSNLSTIMSWQHLPEELDIKVNTLQASIFDAMLTGQAKIKLIEGLQKPDVELMLQLGKMPTQDLLALLPKKIMDLDLTQWLDSAVLAGNHLTTTCVLRGNLADFPFDHAEGTFEVVTELDNVHLDYMQGWPAITDLKANLLFKNRALFISAEKGNIAHGYLSDADAVVPDLFADMPELIIDTKLASNLQTGLVVVKNSPLPLALKNTLAPLNMKGDMQLSLGLEIPLSKKSIEELKVRGLIEVQDASIDFTQWDSPIKSLQGEVSFTENSIQSDKLAGLFFDVPTVFSMATQHTNTQPEIHLGASGKISVEKLKNLFNIPSLQYVSGEADYTAAVIFQSENTSQATLNITSNLQGIAIDAPYPFAKSKQDNRLLEFKMVFDPNQLMRVAVKYGDNVTLAYSLASQNKTWQPVGGQIHFGENRVAKFREDQILLIDGSLSQVDFQEWKHFLTSVGLFTAATQNTSQPHKLEPLVELNIEKLVVFGLPFDKEKIEARWDSLALQWDLNFDGPLLQGHAIIPQETKRQIAVDLKKLAITQSVELPEMPNLEQNTNLQPIEIKIKELVLLKKTITDIKARLEPSWKGYFFPNVTAKLKATDITLSGNWDYLSTHKKVSTEGSISTKNISDTLEALGMQGTVRNAKGTAVFTLSWNGSPMSIDYPTLGGQAEFTLTQGIIHGVNPGIGRVLGLLNLDNVKRRLNLDFSDVTKNGLAFNELTGKFLFGKGKISSNKVTLNGPSAKIEAFGQADLENQGLNGEMIVMPNVTGSLPVAAAIAAGNPAVGAAVWVVDKMLGKKIQQIHRVRYKVLGTWAQPKVEEVATLPLRG